MVVTPLANGPKSAGDIYVDRTGVERPESAPQPMAQPSFAPLPPDSQSGPLIYSGTAPSTSQDDFVRQTQAARNKAVKPRKRSPFNLMLTMILVAVAVVLYVGNVIAVQQLLKDVSDRQTRLQQILNDQEILKAQINRMSSLERIRSIAEDDLGLHNPKGSPEWIEIDGNKLKEIDQSLSFPQPTLQKDEK